MHMMCSGVGALDDRWSGNGRNAHLGGRGEREERGREERKMERRVGGGEK